MVCPYCNTPNNSQVIESRARPSYVSRRRQCLSCKRRFTTQERVATRTEMKLLKDGRNSGHAGFRLLAEQNATLWENQAMLNTLLRRLLRHFGIDDSLPLAQVLGQHAPTKKTPRRGPKTATHPHI